MYARNCSTNGFTSPDMAFELLADWGIRHVATGLCVQAAADSDRATMSLQVCDAANALQQFRNSYTHIRNGVVPMQLPSGLHLAGHVDGEVAVSSKTIGLGFWNQWCYFPNSRQLRNQYTADMSLGYPMCLAACA